MQHPLHNDRPPFPAASDGLRSSPSGNISSCSWAAATTSCSSSVDTCMHADSAASQGHGSFFRQLFSEEGGVDGAGSYVEELLQLQLPPTASHVTARNFDVLSSSEVYDSYASPHCSVGDFDAPQAAFSVESFLTSGGSDAANSPRQDLPHTLEFVSPTAISSCFQSTSMQSRQLSDHADAAAGAALLPDHQSLTVKQGPCEAHHPNHSPGNPDDDQQHTSQIVVSSSCKKARLISQPAEQCSIAGNDPSQVQGILSKQQVQTARSKEKLGERINALQQLVSPFGKTDTASVLSEAIGYIKFLQEQVQVLSSPYMKPTSALLRQDGGIESMSDLRSRGLCLVPVSCTMNVANNNINIGADYWASTAASNVQGGGGSNTGGPSAHVGRLSTST